PLGNICLRRIRGSYLFSLGARGQRAGARERIKNTVVSPPQADRTAVLLTRVKITISVTYVHIIYGTSIFTLAIFLWR
ncbi:MAG: hypothetical protein AAB048_04845, partial [Planctomycetota bacterium]